MNNSLRWDIQCIACQWQTTVRALIPFNGTENIAPITNDLATGFWEDYICPEHYATARRALHISQAGIPLEEAYYRYFDGAVSTTPVPTCPTCHHPMHGGQILNQLPFYLDTQIETQNWLLQKLTALQQMVTAETYATHQQKITPEFAVQTLAAEVEAINRFHNILHRQLNLQAHALILLETTPPDLDRWPSFVASAFETAKKRRLQLERRRQTEAQKTPGYCPQCCQQSVYLRWTNTV